MCLISQTASSSLLTSCGPTLIPRYPQHNVLQGILCLFSLWSLFTPCLGLSPHKEVLCVLSSQPVTCIPSVSSLFGATSPLAHTVKVTLSTSFSARSSSHTSSNSIFRSSHGTTENNWIQLLRLKMRSIMGSKRLRLKFLLLCQMKEEKCCFWSRHREYRSLSKQ